MKTFLIDWEEFQISDLIIKSLQKKYLTIEIKWSLHFHRIRWVLESEPKDVEKNFALGLHMTGRYDKILDIENCQFIQPRIGNKILKVAKEFVSQI